MTSESRYAARRRRERLNAARVCERCGGPLRDEPHQHCYQCQESASMARDVTNPQVDPVRCPCPADPCPVCGGSGWIDPAAPMSLEREWRVYVMEARYAAGLPLKVEGDTHAEDEEPTPWSVPGCSMPNAEPDVED